MRLYKTQFMPENTIYSLHGQIEENIRESYSGGSVDVYIPHNKTGNYSLSNIFKKLYYYDVNSLYPTVMAQQIMPIGLPTAFEGDIRQFESNAFGFFFCKRTSPEFMSYIIYKKGDNF